MLCCASVFELTVCVGSFMYAHVCACHCMCDIMSMYFSVSLFVFMSTCEYGVHQWRNEPKHFGGAQATKPEGA